MSTLAAAVAALGAVPYAAEAVPRPRLVGTAQALAGGLMLGSGYLLMTAAIDRAELLAVAGAGVGVGYVFLVKRYTGTADLELEPDPLAHPAYGYKLLLQYTLHSASEGVAIGVAMVVDLGLGIFVALALAVHNIGEGIAIADLLRQLGISAREAAGLCVAIKVSQPLLALATFALSPVLTDLLAGALGFAAGALVFLVLTELLPESYSRVGRPRVALLVSLAAGTVVLLEDFLV